MRPRSATFESIPLRSNRLSNATGYCDRRLRRYTGKRKMCSTASFWPSANCKVLKDAMVQCADRMRFQQWDCSNVGHIMHDPPILKYGRLHTKYIHTKYTYWLEAPEGRVKAWSEQEVTRRDFSHGSWEASEKKLHAEFGHVSSAVDEFTGECASEGEGSGRARQVHLL